MYACNSGVGGIHRLRKEMDRLFGDLTTSPRAFPAADAVAVRTHALNIWEDEGRVYVEAEIPGMKLEDLDVQLKQNELTIAGERKWVQEPGVAYHRNERGAGSFQRTVQFHVALDASKTEARLKDGVLTLALAKADEAKPRKITVTAG
ncbi:MAG: Hsp20/alpha crystallin family protein [Planctomycetia bacterium]